MDYSTAPVVELQHPELESEVEPAGEPAPVPVPLPPPPQFEAHCPQCGRGLADDYAYCPSCGYESSGLRQCANCGHAQVVQETEEAVHCVNCGTSY